MHYEVPGFVYSMMSEGDIDLYTAVTVNSNGAVEEATATERMDGIAQMDADASDPETIRVMKSGISMAIAGGAITAGDQVTVTTDGKLVSAAGGSVVVGIALTDADGDGSRFSVLLQPSLTTA